MPPKFPHGLKKDPLKMSRAEFAIFGALAGSIGLGIYQLVTSPWSEQKQQQRDEMAPNLAAMQPATDRLTKIEKTLKPPKPVEDGVTKMQFG
jgi:hypothetical protein